MKVRAIIPAAGKGTRLHSENFDAPKVMRECAGSPLLETVLKSVSFIDKNDTYIVVGYKKEQVMDYFGDEYHYVVQEPQMGTGHAVMVCADEFADYDGTVLVTFGDMPLYREKDFRALFDQLEKEDDDCVVMIAENPELVYWSRIIRDEEGRFLAIVEAQDLAEDQKKFVELTCGVFAFKSKSLFKILPMMSTENAQHEYYLTEVPELMVKNGMKVGTYKIADGDDLRGVNTPEDLVRCEQELLKRKNN